MAIVDKISGMFLAKTTLDLEAVREKLSAAEQSLPAFAARVRETALSAALDPATEARHRKAVQAERAAQDTVASLRLALTEASKIETERLAGVRTNQQRAKLRAAKAHLANVVRASEEYEAATVKQSAAWLRMVSATESFQSVVGPTWQRDYSEVSVRRLTRLGELELLRVGHKIENIGAVPYMPGSSAATGRPLVHSLPPISTAVRDLANHYGEHLSRELSLAPPLPPPVEGPDMTFRGPMVGSHDWYEAQEARQRREPGIGMPAAAPEQPQEEEDEMKFPEALRRLLVPEPEPATTEPELPLNPHPEGSIEWAEFEAILAADRAAPPERIHGSPAADTPEQAP